MTRAWVGSSTSFQSSACLPKGSYSRRCSLWNSCCGYSGRKMGEKVMEGNVSSRKTPGRGDSKIEGRVRGKVSALG